MPEIIFDQDRIAMLNNIGDLKKLINDLPDEIEVKFLDNRGNLHTPTMAMEKKKDSTAVYMEIRK